MLHFDGINRGGIQDSIAITEVIAEHEVSVAVAIDVSKNRRVGVPKRLLDGAATPEDAGQRAVDNTRPIADVRSGTMLGREWKGRMHRVAVLSDGFSWNGKTYASLSKIAHAITGTRWNGPRFFGLRERKRDKPPTKLQP